MTAVTEKMVEDGAKAAYEHWNNYPACIASDPWEVRCEKLPGSAKFFRDISRISITAALSTDVGEDATPTPSDSLGGDPALVGIAEEMKESGGHWQPCTGCYDTEDGHPTQKYDYSPALQTAIGCGCHECGGLGAVWWHMTDEEVEDFARISEEVDAEHELTMRIVRLEAALHPFARVADIEERAGPADSVMVNVARCRDARAVLADKRGIPPAVDVVGPACGGSTDASDFQPLFGEIPSPSPFARSVGADLIRKIAQVATSVGFQAGEPAMDIAGMIVSSLVANPENIDRFMVQGSELLLDGTLNFENGSLTYRAVNGSILSPSVLREKKGQQQ